MRLSAGSRLVQLASDGSVSSPICAAWNPDWIQAGFSLQRGTAVTPGGVGSRSMKATNRNLDYFRVLDLNPPAPATPIVDPRDPRAQCWFGFVADGQRLILESTGLPVGTRVLYSWDYDYFTGVGVVPPLDVKPHGALQFVAGPGSAEQMHEGHHERPFVTLWLDGPPPPAGTQVLVSVRGWRKD